MRVQRFKHALSPNALHIDYLRLRCGSEDKFLRHIRKLPRTSAYIAFSEWDVVLFVPSDRLYSSELIKMYENTAVTTAIAGSAGYYNYVWDHDVNIAWERRLEDNAAGHSIGMADVSMLVSLRFIDRYRCAYGIGAELLFLNFLKHLEGSFNGGVELFAAHSVGWNDATVVIRTQKGKEELLLAALTAIRYCKLSELDGSNDTSTVVAATYSHILGNLTRYLNGKLDFGGLKSEVHRAQLLVRVTPAMEPSIRKAYDLVAERVWRKIPAHQRRPLPSPKDRKNPAHVSELGHYNFSADITWAFGAGHGAAVHVIQGLRREILKRLKDIDRLSSSFPETTTEITFHESIPDNVQPQSSIIPLADVYSKSIKKLMERTPRILAGRSSRMTRHRLAILLGSISTYLADPVRGSVVGHLCRFLKGTFETVITRMDRDEQEDLCHVLEYALNQATDGLSQFQHDANSLGLSGRGGYVRVIQAIDQWIVDLLDILRMDLMPLVTFGLQTSTAGTAVKHRIDIPFSTAFAPARWPILFHEVGHLCWHDLFGWRLESVQVWENFKATVSIVDHDAEGDQKGYLSASSIVEEIFPNYLMLNVVATGDVERLDRVMLHRELSDVPRRSISRSVRVRIVLHVLLALHKEIRPIAPPDVLDGLPLDDEIPSNSLLAAKLDTVARSWWNAWSDLEHQNRTQLQSSIDDIIENALRGFTSTMAAIRKRTAAERPSPNAYGRTTELIPTSRAFKEEVSKAVFHCIRLMDVLANDHKIRRVSQKKDPPHATFGEVLARIDRSSIQTKKAYEQWKSAFDQGLDKGFVFSEAPPATVLARLLTDLEIGSDRPDMLPSLSVILSLWHRGVTGLLLEESKELPEKLRALGLICEL